MKLVVKDTDEYRDTEGTDGQRADGTRERTELDSLAEQRGISVRVLAAAGIQPDDGSGQHRGWWRLPYPHRTGVHKVRYRNHDPEGVPRYLDDKGAKFHLYNPLRLGPGEEEVWFAEGEFDTLALIDQGLKAIGVHGVSNVLDEEDGGDRGFRKEWALLFEDTLCITMFDNDDAGRVAGRKLARGLNGEAFDEWDNDYGDANDWHKADPDGMARAIADYRNRVRGSRGLQ